ncbi:unnamed protein product [Protopolystoma xenopodis]|uniref:Uncharacterized protein n=1 Tax=Protopolystoma xenopodis TaxID=117903 RepID=A0A448XP99_9PLAT|nr:unnamed protein product [Protopolystoma xenopodis]
MQRDAACLSPLSSASSSPPTSSSLAIAKATEATTNTDNFLVCDRPVMASASNPIKPAETNGLLWRPSKSPSRRRSWADDDARSSEDWLLNHKNAEHGAMGTIDRDNGCQNVKYNIKDEQLLRVHGRSGTSLPRLCTTTFACSMQRTPHSVPRSQPRLHSTEPPRCPGGDIRKTTERLAGLVHWRADQLSRSQMQGICQWQRLVDVERALKRIVVRSIPIYLIIKLTLLFYIYECRGFSFSLLSRH